MVHAPNEELYHVSETAFEEGDSLLPMRRKMLSIEYFQDDFFGCTNLEAEDMQKHHAHLVEQELAIERVRESHYPHKPSRLDSVFLYMDPSQIDRDDAHIYEVFWTGNHHVTTQGIFANILGGSGSDLEALRHQYWSYEWDGTLSDELEVLIHGDVIISAYFGANQH